MLEQKIHPLYICIIRLARYINCVTACIFPFPFRTHAVKPAHVGVNFGFDSITCEHLIEKSYLFTCMLNESNFFDQGLIIEKCSVRTLTTSTLIYVTLDSMENQISKYLVWLNQIVLVLLFCIYFQRQSNREYAKCLC